MSGVIPFVTDNFFGNYAKVNIPLSIGKIIYLLLIRIALEEYGRIQYLIFDRFQILSREKKSNIDQMIEVFYFASI